MNPLTLDELAGEGKWHHECTYQMCQGEQPHCIWHGHESQGWPCVVIRAIAELSQFRTERELLYSDGAVEPCGILSVHHEA